MCRVHKTWVENVPLILSWWAYWNWHVMSSCQFTIEYKICNTSRYRHRRKQKYCSPSVPYYMAGKREFLFVHIGHACEVKSLYFGSIPHLCWQERLLGSISFYTLGQISYSSLTIYCRGWKSLTQNIFKSKPRLCGHGCIVWRPSCKGKGLWATTLCIYICDEDCLYFGLMLRCCCCGCWRLQRGSWGGWWVKGMALEMESSMGDVDVWLVP